MRITDLRQETLKLAQMAASDAPVVSCYIDLRCRSAVALWNRAAIDREKLNHSELRSFVDAMERIDDFLSVGLQPDTQVAAVFSHAGTRPHFLALQFRVPVATSLQVQSKPCIYGLLDLLDTYESYVALHGSADVARIVEVHLGVVAQETVWHRQLGFAASPIASEGFLAEQVRLLDLVASAGQYRHLILAGELVATRRLMSALPNSLAAKVIAMVSGSHTDDAEDIVKMTLPAFLEYEELESPAWAKVLNRATRGEGL